MRRLVRKLQSRTSKAPPPGLNILPAKDPSITSGLTQEDSEYDYASLPVGSSLALDPVEEDISLLCDEASLTGGDVYPPGYDSLEVSTATGHNSASKVKQATSMLAQ